MALIVFEHHPLETTGRLGTVLNQHGHKLRYVRLHRGEAVPTDLDDVDGVIAMGGPMNVDEVEKHDWMQPEMDYLKAAHDANLPVLGICLGAQMLAHALGGKVAPHPQGCGALGCYALRPTQAGAGLIPDGLFPLSGNLQGFSLPPSNALTAGDNTPRHGRLIRRPCS